MRQKILQGSLLIMLGLLAGRLSDLKPVKAQSSCSVKNLSGSYTYFLNGSYFDNDNNEYEYSSVGQVTADGNNCSGTATFNLALDEPVNVNLYLTNNSKNFSMIETDDGTQVIGQATQQFPPN
jgi:hypothetical protein